MKKLVLILGLSFILTAPAAMAWWNEDWGSRRQLTIDGGATGADIQGNVTEFPVLIRLHAGNFSYFAELQENGKDLRFLKDDKVALKHFVEKVDAFNELGLVWVRVPEIKGGTVSDSILMYYGNQEAVDGSDASAIYDVHQALVYHFDETQQTPQDATAYHTAATVSNVAIDPAGRIGAAAKFQGDSLITIDPQPYLVVDPSKGWTFSSWVRLDQPSPEATLLRASDGTNSLDVKVAGTSLVSSYQSNAGTITAGTATLVQGNWHHVALVATSDHLTFYLDGAEVGSQLITLSSLTPSLTIGRGFVGLLDEVQVATTARSSDWIKLSFRTQSPDFQVLAYGQDESGGDAGGGHFMVIIQNVTIDGWVIIGLTGVMFVVALFVMVIKGLVISRIAKDNRAFMAAYEKLGVSQLYELDREDDSEADDSDVAVALMGDHDHFQSSPLYHLYHAGIRELKKLGAESAEQRLQPEAWDYLRVKLDSQVVRESQRLNSHMVLLTIAIAGGPFLGLLGTVLGVMITFAVIAATGDVNINSIAPGIAAALLATVAGLAVAIPALFAYNYLLTRIKDIVADMRVFTDEFLALLAMQSARKDDGDRS